VHNYPLHYIVHFVQIIYVDDNDDDENFNFFSIESSIHITYYMLGFLIWEFSWPG